MRFSGIGRGAGGSVFPPSGASKLLLQYAQYAR